jgi:FdhE protein
VSENRWSRGRNNSANHCRCKGIAYYGIEGGSAAVKAETCDACHGYLKILHMEKDPNVDALADDVASIALDVLMAESGIARKGTNFFLF